MCEVEILKSGFIITLIYFNYASNTVCYVVKTKKKRKAENALRRGMFMN